MGQPRSDEQNIPGVELAARETGMAALSSAKSPDGAMSTGNAVLIWQTPATRGQEAETGEKFLGRVGQMQLRQHAETSNLP